VFDIFSCSSVSSDPANTEKGPHMHKKSIFIQIPADKILFFFLHASGIGGILIESRQLQDRLEGSTKRLNGESGKIF